MEKTAINKILDIKESFELPDRLMSILFSWQKDEVLDKFMELGESLDHDWFTEYFEEEHANKTKMAQDFTPHEIGELLAGIVGYGDKVADICSGTGGLTIAYWNKYKESRFLCIELSSRAIPFLLLNLCIRNIAGKVIQMDILTGEVFSSYVLIKGARFSAIAKCDELFIPDVDVVISNPPYSLRYFAQEDESRFGEFAGMLPSNFADYCFIAMGLTICKGPCAYILPHGVLFRGNKEGAMRERLCKSRMIRGVIGLPERLFINTDIPTCIVLFAKSDTAFFIDAKSKCIKDKAKNKMLPEHISEIVEVFNNRKQVAQLSHIATNEEIEDNDFNLNISRYVDSFIKEPPPDLGLVAKELLEIDMSLDKVKRDLIKMLRDLQGNDEDSKNIKAYISYLEGKKEGRYEQIRLDL